MLSAGTSEGDRQIAFAFPNVMRHQVNQQLRDAIDELLRLRKLADIGSDLGMLAGQRPKLRNEMWIRQEAYIENQIGIVGHSVLESKAHTGNKNRLVRGSFLELLNDVPAKLVHIELRCIDDHIRQVAEEIEPPTLCADRVRYR